jgi:hypothetical protein
MRGSELHAAAMAACVPYIPIAESRCCEHSQHVGFAVRNLCTFNLVDVRASTRFCFPAGLALLVPTDCCIVQ